MRAGAAASTVFVGRRRELAELSRLLRSTRLLTITGPGGAGKTRLAQVLVARARDPFVAWADLAQLDDGDGVAPAIERAIGARGDGTLSAETIERALGFTPALIVLDNCEHVLGPCREAAIRLLASASRARLLSTSRTPLGILGEVVWPAPPLTLPAADEDGPGRGTRSDAVRLFVDRARDAWPSFVLDATTAGPVRQVCRRLEGLPLAIELAAARLRHVSIRDLAERLDSIGPLADPAGDVPRHRTMTATIDWSYRLLDETDRVLLRRVSVFPGGFTLSGAEAVASDDVPEVLTSVSSLLDQSLIGVSPSTGRYRLLEPIREFAAERLCDHGEEERTTGSAARHLASLTAGETGGEQSHLAIDLRIRDEFANVIAVMPWLIRHESGGALRLLVRAADRHRTSVPVHLSVLGSWLERALAAHVERDELRAQGLDAWARIIWALDLDGLAEMPTRRAVVEALGIAQEIDSVDAKERARFTLTALALRYETRERALLTYDEMVPQLKQARRIASALSGRAVLLQHLGNTDAARRDLESAFAIWATIPGPQVTDRTVTMISAAEVSFLSADLAGAECHLQRAIAARWSTGEAQESTHFDFLAHIAATRGDMARALRLTGIADRLRRLLGTAGLPWFRLADRSWLPRSLAPSESRVVSEGRHMPIASAVRYALGQRVPTGLTEREEAVARLVADGLMDKEIAAQLGISARTAENHVQRVRDKLGLRSRAQVVRWVVESEPVASR